MYNNNFFIRNLWKWKCGIPEDEYNKSDKHINISDLKETEWSSEFEQLMRNRLILGAIRYGKLKDPTKPQYDRIESIINRLKKYKESGNKEHLVDCANLCLCEFAECDHPNAHFKAIDDGEHVNKK